ncbi:MAG: YgfZ/GcvT domain-containing protein [Pirellula staleyi]
MPSAFQVGQGTVLCFRGKDRCRVYNNLCTQDLRKLSAGQAVETFVTDIKGRTFGHGIAFALDEEAYLVTVPNQASKLIPHFDRYIIREDAILSDLSNDFRLWIFRDRLTAANACSVPLESVPEARNASRLEKDKESIVLIHAAWIGPESVLGLIANGASDQPIRDRLGDGCVESDMNERREWELLRIQAAWPWYGIDLDERNLPQELDRNDLAISFNKGCYLGQETIARLDALGQVQKKLVRIAIESDLAPQPQSVVQSDGKDVGTICSSALDVANGRCLALAYVKRSHFKTGQELVVNNSRAVVL